MSARLARTADGWWAVTPAGLVRLGLPATTTAGLLADRAALAAAIEAAHAAGAKDAVPAGSLDLLSPVTAPARVVAQAVNYRSHATDSGFDPDTVPAAFFRKASHSITGPAGDIIRPDGVGFLDYEVELGLVIGADLPVGTTVTEADLARYVAALVVADDVSARQIQLVKTQFYESKSYPTFTPVGTVADPGRRRRPGPAGLAAADPVGERAGPAGQHRGGHDRPARAGTDPAVPVPADGPGRPAADRHARRHRAEGTGQDSPGWSPGCCRPPPGGSCSSSGRRPTPATCTTATSSPRRSPPPTAGSTSAPSTTPLSGRRHDHERNPAAAGVDLPAAARRGRRLARRHRHPVDPGPGRSCPPPGLDLRRAGGHGDPDRQRADRPGGAAR